MWNPEPLSAAYLDHSVPTDGGMAAQPERVLPTGLQTAPDTFRWGFGLSSMLHAAAVLVLLAAPRPQTPAAGDLTPVELIIVPGQPEQAHAAPPDEPAASLGQEAVPDKVPDPTPAPVTPAIPEQPPIPQQQTQSEPAAHPASPVQSHSPAHRSSQRTQTARPAPPVPASGSSPATSASEAHPSADWLADVSAWLAAHRSYPETARRLGRQGTVVLQFTVDPQGGVMDVSLAQSSGSDLLDNAAEAMLRDAHLPPFPPQMNLPRQSLTVPIHYRLD